MMTIKGLKGPAWYWYGLGAVIFLCLMEIRGTLGNWPTITLAAFTMMYVMLIYKSISDTSKFRKDERELAFKRRKLDWIVNWVREVRKCLLTGTNLAEIWEPLKSYAVEVEEILITAKIFGEEFEIIVSDAVEDLWATTTKATPMIFDSGHYIRDLSQNFSNILKGALKVEGDFVEARGKPVK